MHYLFAPEFLAPDIRRSDHKYFWLSGYPAIMITDSCNLRNPNYHQPTDTIQRVNFKKLAALVANLQIMAKNLVSNPLHIHE